MQSLNTPEAASSVADLRLRRRRSDTVLYICIVGVAVGCTPLLVVGGLNSLGLVSGIAAALVVAFLVINWPIAGFYVVAACAVLVEQDALVLQNDAGATVLTTPIFTDQLDVFHWPPSLSGFIERPIGLLFLFILLAIVLRRAIKREPLLQGGYFLWPFVFFLCCVAFGVAHGVVSGGDVKIIVIEVRPLWYMFMAYLLACNLVTQKIHLRIFFWIVIVAAGMKSLQGISILALLLRDGLTFRSIMAHEESYFFISLILLVFVLLFYFRYRPQLFAGLLVLPTVFVAMVANQRRADYIALLLGLAVAWLWTVWMKPQARVKLTVGLVLCVALGGTYILSFAQSTAGFAAPARAVVSIFQPGPQDAASNQYRVIEDFDLKYTAKQNPLFGLGFGKPFYQPIPIPNIGVLDQNYLYIPHNTIYWVWMRLGFIGFLALWFLFGSVIVRGGLIIRQLRDSYLQMTAIYILGAIFMEILVAFADYQLFSFRNVIFLGLLAGILSRLPHVDDVEYARGRRRAVEHEDLRSGAGEPSVFVGER